MVPPPRFPLLRRHGVLDPTRLTGEGLSDTVTRQVRPLRMKTAHFCLFVAALLPQLAACGPSADEACQESAQAYCSKLNACSSATLAAQYGDFAVCLVREKLRCNSLVDADKDTTASRMQSCAKAVSLQSCGEYLASLKPAGCPAGSRPSGSLCNANVQCESGFCDNVPGRSVPSACGVCSSTLPSAGGQLNTGCRGYTPGRGIDVDVEAVSCNRALLCISAPTGGLPGTCVVPLGEGSSCDCGTCEDNNGGCDWNRGLRCIGGVCTPDATARPGEGCAGGQRCVRSSMCWSPPNDLARATCVGGIADGERCFTSGYSSGADCLPPARCLSGTCVVPSAATCK
jgi:hypothetical protein